MKITELKSEGLNKSYKIVIENKEFAKEVEELKIRIERLREEKGNKSSKKDLILSSLLDFEFILYN